MSRLNLVRCDRCGAQARFENAIKDGWAVLTIGPFGQSAEVVETDLCNNCSSDLDDWFPDEEKTDGK